MKQKIFISAGIAFLIAFLMISYGLKENLGQDFLSEGVVDYKYVILLFIAWIITSFTVTLCVLSLLKQRGRMFSFLTKKLVTFVFVILILLLGSYFFFSTKREVYTVMARPDGKYSLVVYKKFSPFSVMPGHGSDAPGEIVLINSKNEVLNKKSLDIVWMATGDGVKWEELTVQLLATITKKQQL